MEVHEALAEKTRAEQGSHNLAGPLRPTLVSAALHQTPLEVIVFKDWKHQSTGWHVGFFESVKFCDHIISNPKGKAHKWEKTITVSHNRTACVGIAEHVWKSLWVCGYGRVPCTSH